MDAGWKMLVGRVGRAPVRWGLGPRGSWVGVGGTGPRGRLALILAELTPTAPAGRGLGKARRVRARPPTGSLCTPSDQSPNFARAEERSALALIFAKTWSGACRASTISQIPVFDQAHALPGPITGLPSSRARVCAQQPQAREPTSHRRSLSCNGHRRRIEHFRRFRSCCSLVCKKERGQAPHRSFPFRSRADRGREGPTTTDALLARRRRPLTALRAPSAPRGTAHGPPAACVGLPRQIFPWPGGTARPTSSAFSTDH